MRKIVCMLICSFLLIAYPISSVADSITFIEEYKFQSSEFDTPLSSRTMAYENVRRPLLEKIVLHLESYPEIKDLHLDKEIIKSLTAVAFLPEIISEKSYGGSYYIKARVTENNNQFLKYHKAVQRESHKMRELVLLEKWLDESLIEAEKRKKELDATHITGRQGKIDHYMQVIKQLDSANAFKRGYSYALFGRHREAIDNFTRVIDYNPNNSAAYYHRGLSYLSLKNKQLAIQDFENCMKGVVVNNNSINGYRDQKSFISKNENPEEIIRNMSKAIDMKHDDADAFYNRGTAYLVMRKYDNSINDFNKAIELKPEDLGYHYNRKVAWENSMAADSWIKLPPSKEEIHRRRQNETEEAAERRAKEIEERNALQRRMVRESYETDKQAGTKRKRGYAIGPDGAYPLVGKRGNLAIDPSSGRIYPVIGR